MAEAEDKLARLCFGDRTFKQLALRVQRLVSVTLQWTNKAVQEAHGVPTFLQALLRELSREIECWRYCMLAEVQAEAEQQLAFLQ